MDNTGLKDLLLTRNQSRIIDKLIIEQFGLPGVVLMENAGHGIAQYLLSLKPKGKVIICCGKGNNGGDGYVIARYLDIFNIPVKVLVFANEDEIKGDARTHYNVIKKMRVNIEYLRNNITNEKLSKKLNEAEWIIDGLFGSGLTGKLETFFSDAINIVNDSNAKILAIDIPSGLDCDTGEVLGNAIKANHTCTLVSLKKGFLNNVAKQYLGEIKIIDIGIPRQVLQMVEIQH